MGEYEGDVVRASPQQPLPRWRASRSANVEGMKERKGKSRKTRNRRKMKKTRDDKMMAWYNVSFYKQNPYVHVHARTRTVYIHVHMPYYSCNSLSVLWAHKNFDKRS